MTRPHEFPTEDLSIPDQISAMTVAAQTKGSAEASKEPSPPSPLPPGLDVTDQQDAMAVAAIEANSGNQT